MINAPNEDDPLHKLLVARPDAHCDPARADACLARKTLFVAAMALRATERGRKKVVNLELDSRHCRTTNCRGPRHPLFFFVAQASKSS
jgi:hypothetical protein